MKLLVLCTSAPHFPLELARQSYHECLAFLGDNFNYEFIELDEIITGTNTFDEKLRDLKLNQPDAMILIQGAFTWDNIAVYLHEYFNRIFTLLWTVPEKDYNKGVLGANSLCGAIMNNAAFHKLGMNNLFYYGKPQELECLRKIGDILKSMECAKKIEKARYGMVGYRPTGFYNSTFDEMSIRGILGIETVYLDLAALLIDTEVIEDIILQQDINNVKKIGRIGEASEESFLNSSKIYLALKRFIEEERIDFLSVQCWPVLMKRSVNPCLVLGRLTDEKIAAACESDFGGALSMAIGVWLTDSGGVWLADLIDINKKNQSMYFWHCGAAPPSLSDERELPVINKQFRGLDRCNTCEFVLKEGEVTVLRFGITQGRHRIFAFKGRSVFPEIRIRGNISEILPEREPESVLGKMVEYGIEHHLAILYGDELDNINRLSKLLGIDFFTV